MVDSNESLLFRGEEVELLFSEASVGLDEEETELLESLEDLAEVRLEAGDASELCLSVFSVDFGLVEESLSSLGSASAASSLISSTVTKWSKLKSGSPKGRLFEETFFSKLST